MSDLDLFVERSAAKRTPAPPVAPPVPEPERAPSYEQRTKRITFHVDRALIAELTRVAAETGRSKSSLVNEALRARLG